MKYLLDTNVLSELRKGTRCDAHVARWADAAPSNSLFVSVLVLGEIRRGVERLRRKDPKQAKRLGAWLEQVKGAFAGRILGVDEAVAESWGSHDVPEPKPVVDGLLAATARVHGLTLVTRNTADFKRTGVAVLNPFGG